MLARVFGWSYQHSHVQLITKDDGLWSQLFSYYVGSNESASDISTWIEIEFIHIEYSDIEAGDQNQIEENNADRRKIKQASAHNSQDLVGNARGYIGSFWDMAL